METSCFNFVDFLAVITENLLVMTALFATYYKNISGHILLCISFTNTIWYGRNYDNNDDDDEK